MPPAASYRPGTGRLNRSAHLAVWPRLVRVSVARGKLIRSGDDVAGLEDDGRPGDLMAKHRKAARTERTAPNLVARAMLRRVEQRTTILGTLKIPAVPALLDRYVEICSALAFAMGRALGAPEEVRLRALLSNRLEQSFAGSPRSKVAIHFEAPPGRPFGIDVAAEIRTLAAAYETWIGSSSGPLFGAHPDARVLTLADTILEPPKNPILDLGAGTGRNALALARRGHPVDAVEITPKFAEMIADEASKERLSVRVLQQDVMKDPGVLRRDYLMLIASEVVPDFRGTDELRALFELAADVLADGGLLVFNVHLVDQGYTPDTAARQFAQQCYSALFTQSELTRAAAELPLELVGSDSVHDFEKEHLPPDAWPPTPWFRNWVLGLDVYETGPEKSPVRLVWLVYRKAGRGSPGPGRLPPQASVVGWPRAKRHDPAELRQALVRRLSRRAVASGTLTFPAVPALVEHFVQTWFRVVSALGRRFERGDLTQARSTFETVFGEAHRASPRSNVIVSFEAPMGEEIRYQVTADAVPISAAYEDWLETVAPPLFGAHPDARVLALLEHFGEPGASPVLDVGAGLGRNALELAARGFPVDAVEMTPKFASQLVREATDRGLPVRVIARDIFEAVGEIGRGYRLMVLSSVVGDFRGPEQLRRILELAAEVLGSNGLLVMSVHVARRGYEPDPASRQWAEQCCAMFFTKAELARAEAGLSLRLIADDSAYAYERTHLPEEFWPPTEAFAEWALGTHMFALEREQCPIELRWMVWKKVPGD